MQQLAQELCSCEMEPICCETWINASEFVMIRYFALTLKMKGIYIYMQGLGRGWVQYEDYMRFDSSFKMLQCNFFLTKVFWEKKLIQLFIKIFLFGGGGGLLKKGSPCTCHPLKVGKNGIPMTVPSGANFKSPNIFFTVTSACSAVELPWTAFWRIFLP